MFNNKFFNPARRLWEEKPDIDVSFREAGTAAILRWEELLTMLRGISNGPLDGIDFKVCAAIAAREVARNDGDLCTKLSALLAQLYVPQT